MQKKLVLALIMSSAFPAFGQEAGPVAQEVITPEVAPVSEPHIALSQSQAEVPATPALETQITEPMVPTPATEQVQTQTAQAPATVEAPAPTQAPLELPEQPAAIEVAPIAQEPSEDEAIEIKSLDTVSVNEPKGNWLYKRIWWEKAERLYEKIKQLADKIMESRITFFNRRHELDHSVLDPFYLNLGLKQGELSEIVSYFTQRIEKDEQEGPLDEKEQALRATIIEEKKTLEQLQKDAENVTKIDHALDDALMKLIEQLNQARYYEQQSWENFKMINRELSDKRARELYYGMDTYWKNLNSINTYLSDAFSKYFDQLTTKVQQETDKINNTIQALKEKGIDIHAQAESMKKACKIPEKEAEEPQEETSTGIMGTLWRVIKAPFNFVGSIFSGIFDMVSGLFGGGSSDEVTLAKPSRAATNESIDAEQEIQEDQE